MVRTYTRKTTQHSWSEISMQRAIDAVRNGDMGYDRASEAFGVPKTTLFRRSKSGKVSTEASHKTLGRFRTIFTSEQEAELKRYILTMEERLFGLTIDDLRALAYQYADLNNIPHTFPIETGVAGRDWVSNFMRRHSELSLRQPESTSAARACAFNRIVVAQFFSLLENLMITHKFPPSRIYNCDETGISTVPTKMSKVLSLKGKKQVGALASGERGTLTTAEICFNAAGNYIPPFMVFPRVKTNVAFSQGLPPESVVACHVSGWMQMDIFAPQWFNHFLRHTRPTSSDPVLLILDGHSTHVKNLKLVEMARENNVHILVIPPHTSHRIQPLDVSFMKPLSTYYEQEVKTWLRNNPGKVVTIHNIGPLFGIAYLRAATSQIAINAFLHTGICPFNANIFPDHYFAPSETTDRVIVGENDVSVSSSQPSNLQSSNLQPSNLQSSNLQPSNLQSSNLQPSNLQSSNLQPSNLQSSNLQSSNLQSSNLQPSNPQSSNLQPSNLQSSNLQPSNPQSSNLQPSSNLQSSNLQPFNPQKRTLCIASNNENVDPHGSTHFSPEDIKPIPKVSAVTQVRHKTRRGKTMVLTATPNVQELRSQKSTTLRPNLKRAKKTLINVFNKESSIQKKIKEIKAAQKKVVISSESDSDEFFEDSSSDEYEPRLQSKSKRVQSMFSASGKNKLVKEPKKANAMVLNKNLFKPILPADSPSTSDMPETPSVSNIPKKNPGDKEEAWYCFVCDQNEVKDMRLCINCLKYAHDECIGYTDNDIDDFVCPDCQ